MNPFDAMPQDRRDAALAAVRATFGGVPAAAAMVDGGASGAHAIAIAVRGRRYLVRVEGVASPLRNPHQYAAMRIAAAAGIAPAVHHVDEVGRVAVMDFVDARPLAAFPGGARGLAAALGGLRTRVAATAAFPAFIDYPDIVARLWAHVVRTGLFATGVLDRHGERLMRVRAAYAEAPGVAVSSHNDPVPRNILFDGARLWLIDWESACRNDPLVDVAIMLDNLAASPARTALLLHAWLGRAPDAGVLRRLVLVRALSRLYYAGVLLSASAAAFGARGDTDLSAPRVAAFRQALRGGQLSGGAPATKHVMGKMYLAAFLDDRLPPGLEGAV